MVRNHTVDPAEVAKFERMAAEWWSPHGKFRPLHMLNPCRLEYIVKQICAEFGLCRDDPVPFSGLRILDIGCGGGLLAEPMARLGAEVIGVDVSETSVAVAQTHATQSGLDIDYRCTTVEKLAEDGQEFNVLLNMEVIEHVTEPAAFLQFCATLLKPGGLMICSTINRTLASLAKAKIGAEYILGWLPRGTHDWQKFISPEELEDMFRETGLVLVDRQGFVFNPLSWRWAISDRDMRVNYVTACIRPLNDG